MAVSTKTTKKQIKTVSAPAPAQVNGVEGCGDLKQAILRNLTFTLARDLSTAKPRDWWIATSLAVREQILARLIKTQAVHNKQNVRRLYYLSLEYLMGRLFENNLYNTDLYGEARTALKELGVDWESVRESEVDMGLGNGGLGRLAACFLDSLATLDLPAKFNDLAHWGAEWSLDSEKARHFKRVYSDLETVQSFFNDVNPRMDEIIGYLNTLNILDPKELALVDRNLYYLAATCIEMSHPIDMKWRGTDIDDKFPSERLHFVDVPGR